MKWSERTDKSRLPLRRIRNDKGWREGFDPDVVSDSSPINAPEVAPRHDKVVVSRPSRSSHWHLLKGRNLTAAMLSSRRDNTVCVRVFGKYTEDITDNKYHRNWQSVNNATEYRCYQFRRDILSNSRRNKTSTTTKWNCDYGCLSFTINSFK